MFCPKCGTQNPENGKFCRNCGTDLSPISEALSGKSKGFGMIEPIQPMQVWDKKGRPVTLESAFGKIFMGIAFLIVSLVLAYTGKGWWFWMLLPAFGMLGSGLAHYTQLKKNERRIISNSTTEENKTFTPVPNASTNASLPPTQTEYIPPAESHYKTGDLVPPSVVEATTRHLEINQEGETMTLPKK
jgi:hypothetical protein